MKLIYRAQVFVSTDSPVVLSYRKPRALNWRFHAPGEIYGDRHSVVEQPYVAPRALNWRWQIETVV